MDGAKELFKVSPCTLPTSLTCTFKGTNGLSSPQIIDVNGDGKVDMQDAISALSGNAKSKKGGLGGLLGGLFGKK